MQAKERLQGATGTISLLNGASDTLTNRFLRAHAEAWFTFKYSHDYQTGTLVPQAFLAMTMPLTWNNVYTVRCVRERSAGESEHQDLAPHAEDVQRAGQPSGSWNQGSDEAYGGFWGNDDGGSRGGDEDDLPDYEED